MVDSPLQDGIVAAQINLGTWTESVIAIMVHMAAVVLTALALAQMHIVSREKHSLLVSLSACPFMVMMRPGQKDTSNLMF